MKIMSSLVTQLRNRFTSVGRQERQARKGAAVLYEHQLKQQRASGEWRSPPHSGGGGGV